MTVIVIGLEELRLFLAEALEMESRLTPEVMRRRPDRERAAAEIRGRLQAGMTKHPALRSALERHRSRMHGPDPRDVRRFRSVADGRPAPRNRSA